MDVAVITSTAHLGDLSALGSVDMALTHLVLANPDQARHFRARSAAGVRVLLDNSAYELETVTGAGMAAEPVLRAAEAIDAAVVVCTDVIFDGPATVRTSRAFLAKATARMPERAYMGVPQGRTRAEWLDCYRRLLELPGIGMIGLSKLSVPRCFPGPVAESRLRCVAAILEIGEPSVPLHLLGGDRSLPWELAAHRARGHDRYIASNDSSFCFWYAASGIPVDDVGGRAAREAPDKPDLEGAVLTTGQRARAKSYVALVRSAAGLAS